MFRVCIYVLRANLAKALICMYKFQLKENILHRKFSGMTSLTKKKKSNECPQSEYVWLTPRF